MGGGCPQVEREVLTQYESELLEKEHSGCAALLNDDKVRCRCLVGLGFMQLSSVVLQVEGTAPGRSKCKRNSRSTGRLSTVHGCLAVRYLPCRVAYKSPTTSTTS